MGLHDFIASKQSELDELKMSYESLAASLNEGCDHSVCDDCKNKKFQLQSEITAMSQKINDLDSVIKELNEL